MNKFKVGDKIAVASQPENPIYVITKVIDNMTYDCRDIRGTAMGRIDKFLISQWVVAHDDNYRVDKILTKYNAL